MTQAITRQTNARHLLVMQLIGKTGALSGTEEDVQARPARRRAPSAGLPVARRVEIDASKVTIDRMTAMREQSIRSLMSR